MGVWQAPVKNYIKGIIENKKCSLEKCDHLIPSDWYLTYMKPSMNGADQGNFQFLQFSE